MNQMGGGGVYIAIFPTVLPTEHLLLSVALNSVDNELIFAPKIFENPARLFDPSINVPPTIPSVNVPTSPSVNMPTDHASDMRALRDVHQSSVNPSVNSSVIVTRTVNVFQLSMKYRRVPGRRYCRR